MGKTKYDWRQIDNASSDLHWAARDLCNHIHWRRPKDIARDMDRVERLVAAIRAALESPQAVDAVARTAATQHEPSTRD